MSDETKAGSGITSREIVRGIQEASAKHFNGLLESGNVKPKQRQLANDAFKDGMRMMLWHLMSMGIVVVLDGE